MSDNEIGGLIQYEHEYDLDLRHPATDDPIGVKFKIRSAGSAGAKQVLRQLTDANIKRRARGKLPTPEQLEKEEIMKTASYIIDWDWGTKTWNGTKPEFSFEKAQEILEAEGWIFSQVSEAATKAENFIKK